MEKNVFIGWETPTTLLVLEERAGQWEVGHW